MALREQKKLSKSIYKEPNELMGTLPVWPEEC